MLINVTTTNANIKDGWLSDKKFLKSLRTAHDSLHNLDRSSGTGWVELPNLTTETEIENIKTIAEDIKSKAEVLVVIGIGGSYAGTKAALEMLKPNSPTEIVFMGTTFSATEINNVISKVNGKDFCVCVISKSGGTTETLLAFNFIFSVLQKKYKKGGEYKNRVYVITDYEKGYLHDLAAKENFTSLVIPRTVGGRYSVLSPVGLLPLAVAGIDIKNLLEGAKKAYNDYFVMNLSENKAYLYGALRYFMNTRHKKSVEVVATFDDRLYAFFEWFKQLFAESEGKDKKGLFVSSLVYSTDLHSFGQFLQDGSPITFETIIKINKPQADIKIENLPDNSPIAVMNGKMLSDVINATTEGVICAHKQAGVPIIMLEVDELNEMEVGGMFYFFEVACAISSYLIGVNPFNQPGVEAYKTATRNSLNKTEN